MLDAIALHMALRKAILGLPISCPTFLFLDNVSFHSGGDYLSTVPGTNIKTYAGLFLLYTLPGRSHTQNVGDQLINKVLHSFLAREASMRISQHVLGQVLGDRDSTLNQKAMHMKGQMVQWLTGFITHPQLASWVMASWKAVLSPKPVAAWVFY